MIVTIYTIFAIIQMARVPGFEPGIVVPKTTALPLGHTRTTYEKRLGETHDSVSHALYSTR